MKDLSIVKAKKVVVQRPGLKVVYFTLNAGDVIPEHHSKVDAIVTTIRGKGIFIIDGVEHEMRPGSVLDMHPGTPHSIKAIEALEFVAVHAQLAENAEYPNCSARLKE